MKTYTPSPEILTPINEMISNIRKQGFEVVDLDDARSCAVMGAGLMSMDLDTALARVKVLEEALEKCANWEVFKEPASSHVANEALAVSREMGDEL